jgi:uncharacterized membrane protein
LAAAGRRIKHAAAICLALIGLVVLTAPRWPVVSSEAAWWGLFFVGLGGHLTVRKRICD